MRNSPRRPPDRRPGVSLARALSKLGFCSRSQGRELVEEGRVRVNGAVRRDPELRVDPDRDRIEVDGARVAAEERVYLMLNKPRGLVTTASDERGRGTVYDVLDAPGLPFVSPVGRLDRASEGLLLFTNDTRWAARILDPATHLDKTYHVQVDRLADEERVSTILAHIQHALAAIRTVVNDSPAMADRATDLAGALRTGRPAGAAAQADATEAADLPDWMTAGHVTFLGYRRRGPAGSSPAGQLGLLRDDLVATMGADGEILNSPPPAGTFTVQQFWLDTALGRGHATLLVSVQQPEADSAQGGTDVAEFLVGLTPPARSAEITTVPVVRRLVGQVLAHLGAAPDSYSGQRALEALSNYPRAELFWADLQQLTAVVTGQLQLSSRRRVRTFLQPDPQGRFTSALVFLPRDRYTTARRLAMQKILLDTFHGTSLRYTAHIGDALLASVHFTIATDPATRVHVDVAELNRDLRLAVRSWEDQLASTVVGGDDDLDTAGALSRYADAFDEAYKEDYSASDAVEDLKRLDEVSGPDDLVIALGKPSMGAPGDSRLKLYVTDSTVSLSQAMPILQSMGVHVVDERPYEVRRTDGRPSRIYDFGLAVEVDQQAGAEDLADVKRRFGDAFVAAWHGWSEVDGFNALVLAARLEWRQIAVLRAYAKYLRQIGSAYTQGYLEQVLAQYPMITANLVALFATRFDPDLPSTGRDTRCQTLASEIAVELDKVASLDADRILRTFLQLIEATVRTNAFVAANLADGMPHLSFKLDPHRAPGIPKPVPAHEIWVYSPRVEGVHLRFGAVARGGLRWSDRPEDFRTEVLGLVKAQEVKNAIIVPVGMYTILVDDTVEGPRASPKQPPELWQAPVASCPYAGGQALAFAREKMAVASRERAVAEFSYDVLADRLGRSLGAIP